MADRGAGGSPVEFMHDFAYLLPVTVICELIGIPEADREGFRPSPGTWPRCSRSPTMRACPRSTPPPSSCSATSPSWPPAVAPSRSDDLLSDLLAISDSGDGRLTDAELLHNLTLLLVAGFETTTNLLGNGLQIILHDQPAGARRCATGRCHLPPSSRKCFASTRPSS